MISLIDFQSDSVALLVETADQTVSYRQLGILVDQLRGALGKIPRPVLAFQFVPNGLGAVVTYLACLAEGIPLGFGEPAEGARSRIIAAYRPGIVIISSGAGSPGADYGTLDFGVEGIGIWIRSDADRVPVKLSPELGLLLATSGSTGDAKYVRLSQKNLAANALSIVEYLGIGPSEVAIQSLPIHYSYGLSVLNSHLIRGASVILTRHSFMRPEFWRAADDCRCTSFAGVPYMYETLQRLRINAFDRKTIRTVTQAGGHLRPEFVKSLHEAATAARGRLFVMYGQTEATARIAYVPPERLGEKMGSIGIPIPGGRMWLERIEGAETGVQQLYYQGANVMMGYANSVDDLSRGDDLQGVLATGDLAEMDEEGFYRIAGRLARFAKLFGKRVNLFSVESEVEHLVSLRAVALDAGDQIRVHVEKASASVVEQLRQVLPEWLGVPPSAVRIASIDEIPLTASGKKNYKALV